MACSCHLTLGLLKELLVRFLNKHDFDFLVLLRNQISNCHVTNPQRIELLRVHVCVVLSEPALNVLA